MGIPLEISIERMTGQRLAPPPMTYPNRALWYWVFPHCKKGAYGNVCSGECGEVTAIRSEVINP